MNEKDWKRYSRYLADRVRGLMHSQSISQNALAVKMNRTQQYVSHILNGRENLTLETIYLLGQALETDLVREMFLKSDYRQSSSGILEDGQPSSYNSHYSSSLPALSSAEVITRCFETGDRPFLVTCNDSRRYLCKAAKYSSGPHSLARELTGTALANIWGLADAPLVLINLSPRHVGNMVSDINYELPCLGRLWIDDAVEVRDTNHHYIASGHNMKERILKIALFDMWLSNEDRLTNNLNILYSFRKQEIYAIDHAGIFNTGFTSPLLQLSLYDSILYSRLFEDVSEGAENIEKLLTEMRTFFDDIIQKSASSISGIWSMIPSEWKIEKRDFDSIMEFIFSEKWLQSVFSNFQQLLNIRLK